MTVVERAAGWTAREVRAGERVTLESPGVHFDVDEMYGAIPLDP